MRLPDYIIAQFTVVNNNLHEIASDLTPDELAECLPTSERHIPRWRCDKFCCLFRQLEQRIFMTQGLWSGTIELWSG